MTEMKTLEMNKTLKLKVCGMCATENVAALTEVQPDMMGFIFHESSPRFCAHVPEVIIPSCIIRVGVFVNSSLSYILDKKQEFDLNMVQLHGKESPEFCLEVQQYLPVMKAFNLSEDFDFRTLDGYKDGCTYFLFDASGPNAGGNGVTFNWELLQQYKGNTPFFLSGGIRPSMAADILKIQHPSLVGIDINSGFEIRPGFKDIEKIKQFKYELSS